MAEKEEKQTASAKLNSYMEKNKKGFLWIFVVLVVALVALIVVTKVADSSKTKALEAIDEITFTLTDGSSSLEEGELNARRIDAIDNLASYVNKGGIVGARANLLCADLYYQMEKYTEAVSYWKAAADKSKKSYIAPLAYFNIASASEEMKNLDDALAYYKLAADSNNFAMTTHAKFSYGRVLEAQGKTVEAVAAYTELNDSNPDDSWAKLAKTRIIALKAEGKAE